MLNSRQRAQLRAMANSYETIFQIGKGGITEAFIKQVDEALEARELIKLRVLENCDYSPKEAAAEISEKLACEVVCVVGSRFVLYRESKKNKKIEL